MLVNVVIDCQEKRKCVNLKLRKQSRSSSSTIGKFFSCPSLAPLFLSHLTTDNARSRGSPIITEKRTGVILVCYRFFEIFISIFFFPLFLLYTLQKHRTINQPISHSPTCYRSYLRARVTPVVSCCRILL